MIHPHNNPKCSQCEEELKPNEQQSGVCFTCAELENNRRRRLAHGESEARRDDSETILQHNHGPKFGVIVSGCPRCEQLKRLPYIAVFKLGHHKKIQRVPVASVRAATELIQAQLPAESLRVPVVLTAGGQVVAILKFN